MVWSSSSPGAITFSATVRSSASCEARYTTPMPPRPAPSSMRCPAKTEPVASSLTPSGLAPSGGPGNRTPTCGFGDRHPSRWTSPPEGVDLSPSPGVATVRTAMADPTRADMISAFIPVSPFVKELGIELVHLGADEAELRLPWAPRLATMGDVVHGGAIAALLDTAGMAAAWSDDTVPENL